MPHKGGIAGYPGQMKMNKPQPYNVGPEGKDRVKILTPENPNPSTGKNPKTNKPFSGPGPNFG